MIAPILGSLAVLIVGFYLVFRHQRMTGARYGSAGGGFYVTLAAILVWRILAP